MNETRSNLSGGPTLVLRIYAVLLGLVTGAAMGIFIFGSVPVIFGIELLRKAGLWGWNKTQSQGPHRDRP